MSRTVPQATAPGAGADGAGSEAPPRRRARPQPQPRRGLPASLRRLYPHAREIAPRIALGMASALLAAAVALAIPRVLQAFVNGPLAEDSQGVTLWLGVAAVFALGVAEPALITARRRLVLAPGNRLEAKLRLLLYRHLVDLPPQFHDTWGGGQLLSRVVSDVRTFRRWLTFGSVMIVVNTLTIVGGMALMTVTSPLLGAVYIVAAAPALIVSLRARARYRGLARRGQDQTGDLSTTIEESVHGIRVIKAFGHEERALEGFTEQAEDLRETELGKARSRATVSLAMTLLPDSALAVALVLGVLEVANGSLSVGALVAFFATAAIIGAPLERLNEQFAMSMDASSALDRYFELLDVPTPVPEPRSPVALGRVRGELTFERVSFTYPGQSEPAIDDLSLRLSPGETLALVGLTGSGKSTLAQLVPRFYQPDAGRVLIDGVDIATVGRADLRSAISIAFEDPVLFSASVRENVALGSPDAHDDDVRRALEVAEAGFVFDLPDGWNTVIGEEGMSLSGGQRQRLSLARAIVARPPVLVLDDPLSALDVRTEARVTESLRAHLAGTTTLVVARRPSTVALADRVAIIDEGRIVAHGPHRELLQTNALYRRIILTESDEPELAEGQAP